MAEKVIIKDDGTEVHYKPDGKNVLWYRDPTGHEVHYNGAGMEEYTKEKDGSEVHYGYENGQYVSAVKSPDGQETRYFKDGSVKATKDGHGNEIEYYNNGILKSSINSSGNKLQYFENGQLRLKKTKENEEQYYENGQLRIKKEKGKEEHYDVDGTMLLGPKVEPIYKENNPEYGIIGYRDQNGRELSYNSKGGIEYTKDEKGFEKHYGICERVISYGDKYSGKKEKDEYWAKESSSVVVKQWGIEEGGRLTWTRDKNGNETFYDARGEVVLAMPIKEGDKYTLIDRDGRKIYKEGNREGHLGNLYGHGGIECIVDTKGNTIYYKDGHISDVDYVKDKNGKETHYTNNKINWTKDKYGNETHYYNDGVTVKSKLDQNGNKTEYYENGKVSYAYDKMKNIEKRYREDGTLEEMDNLKAHTTTTYGKDGKTVDRIYTENDQGSRSFVFDKGKVIAEYSQKYNGDGTDVKEVKANYNDDGTFNNWTVKKRKEDWGEQIGDETVTTYKKDDIKAIMSGDVPGYAFIDANKPEYYDNKGDPVWVKEAKKKANDKIAAKKVAKTTQRKSTANALKAQKEKQAVQGFTAANGFGAPWAEASQKKVVAKTAQKAKTTTKAKTTAKKVTKTNSGRS